MPISPSTLAALYCLEFSGKMLIKAVGRLQLPLRRIAGGV